MIFYCNCSLNYRAALIKAAKNHAVAAVALFKIREEESPTRPKILSGRFLHMRMHKNTSNYIDQILESSRFRFKCSDWAS